MAIIAWPSVLPEPQSLTWRLRSNTQMGVSTLSGVTQTQELPGARWLVDIEFPPMNGDTLAAFEAFVVSLRGQANRTQLWPQHRPGPFGVGGGTPLVKGAGQTGAAVLIDGCPISTTAWLKAGAFVGINGQVLQLRAQANTDGAGEVTLQVEPPMRYSPADNAPVTIQKPLALFMLASAEVGVEIGANLWGRSRLSLLEDIPPP